MDLIAISIAKAVLMSFTLLMSPTTLSDMVTVFPLGTAQQCGQAFREAISFLKQTFKIAMIV